MKQKQCGICGKMFETSNDSNGCYDCTLKSLIGGFPPEEGDFNSARIASGSLSLEEQRQMQRSFLAIELGISEDNISSWEFKKLDDGYGYCPGCGFDERECICGDFEDEGDGGGYVEVLEGSEPSGLDNDRCVQVESGRHTICY